MPPSSMITFRQATTLAVVAALIVTVLPQNVRGFMPTQKSTQDTGSEGSSTHESITREVIIEYDKDLFRLGNKPLTQGMTDALETIIEGNSSVDAYFGSEFLKSSAHFDGDDLKGSQERLVEYKLKVKDLVDPPHRFIIGKAKPNVRKAREILGKALHTLQDFYSHSNWVELGNTNPYAVLGVPGNPLTNPPDTTQTCTDCTRNQCTDCYDPATGLTNLTTSALTTGYYLFERCAPLLGCETFEEDRIKPNDFKCSHGGKVVIGPANLLSGRDASGKGTISSGINKDTKVCRISPHNDKHLAAADLARKATKIYLDDLKRRLGVRKMKVLLGGGPTLAMAIDTSGSMEGVIAQVQEQAIDIVDSRLNTEEEPSQYVLAPFNDPDVGPVTVTDDPDEFRAAISVLSANEGGDCPELAMTGMLQALNNMDEAGGELLMFTDASAKDGGLAGTVASLALSKNIKISPIVFGSCSPIDPGFIKLANDTGGQLFVLSPSEAGSITRLADFLIRSRAVDLLAINDTLTDVKTYPIPVDSTMTSVTFAVSGATDVVVRRPNGSQVQPDTDAQYVPVSGGRIYSIANPVTGSWSVTIGTLADISLRVSGESSLDFSYFRFNRPIEPAPHPGFFTLEGFPLVNETATIEAQLSAEAATVNLDLRTPSGAPLQQISATEVGWANDDPDEESFTIGPVRQFIAGISTPNTPFRAYATGQDANGFPYQRVITGTTKPQTIKVTPPVAEELIPGQTTTYTFTLTNFGSPDTFASTGADDNGFLSGVSPASLTLGTNETQNVTVSLTPPPDAGDQALDTLTLTVESTGASQAFNYARVKSLVKPNSTLVFETVTATETGGNGNGIIESGEGGTVNAALVNIGGNLATGVSVTLSSSTPGVTILSGVSAYADMQPAGLATNASPLTFALDSSVICGQSINLTLTAIRSGGTTATVFDLPVQIGQTATQMADPVTVSYTGPPAPIPDANINGVNVPLTVSGFTGAVADLKFRFDGSSCTDAAGATTVGLDHSWLGDLVVTLTSPGGKTVLLINRPDSGGNSSNNFCNTLLDDASTGGSVRELAAAAPPPHIGSFKPFSPLAAFKGENPNGTWILNVSDRVDSDTGNVRAFSLIISGATCDTSTTPQADLTLSGTASPNPVMTGSNFTYTLTVGNNGPSAAQDVVVTNNLPAQTTFVSCGATGGGSCGGNGNSRTVAFPSLAAGASETITMMVNVNCPVANGTSIINAATVSSPTDDPDSDNNAVVTSVTASNPVPIISNVSANPVQLWPPNHAMANVTLNYTVADNCGPSANTLSVTSNEPINGTGDGDIAPDWQVVDDHHVLLRAERAGSGGGRIYTISILSVDSAGNTSSASVNVGVNNTSASGLVVKPNFAEFLAVSGRPPRRRSWDFVTPLRWYLSWM